MEQRTLSVFLTLHDEDHFEVTVMDNESGEDITFNQDTSDIETKIGVEVMSWLDMMTYEEE